VIIVSYKIFEKSLSENQEFEKNVIDFMNIVEMACFTSNDNRKQVEQNLGKFDFSVKLGGRRMHGFTRNLKFDKYTFEELNGTKFHLQYDIDENLRLEYNNGNYKLINKSSEITNSMLETYKFDLEPFFNKIFTLNLKPSMDNEIASVGKLILDKYEEMLDQYGKLIPIYCFSELAKGQRDNKTFRLLRMMSGDWWMYLNILEVDGQIQYFANNYAPYDKLYAKQLWEDELSYDFRIAISEKQDQDVKITVQKLAK